MYQTSENSSIEASISLSPDRGKALYWPFFAGIGDWSAIVDRHLVSLASGRVAVCSSKQHQSAATRRCTNRKYRAIRISANPFTPSTTGAVNMGTSHPDSKFPIGMPPRNAQL
jgi:hypothetical protein